MTALMTAPAASRGASALAVAVAVVLGMGVGAARGVHVQGHPQPVEPFALLPAAATRAAAPPAPDVDPFAAANPALTHRVQPGETLAGIARRYGLDAGSVARTNGIDRPSRLRPGERLLLLHHAPYATPEAARAGAPALDALLGDAAAANGLDPALLRAVAWRESRWDQAARSSKGAIGVLQVMPQTGAAVSRRLGRPLHLDAIEDNIAAGAAYLAERLAARDGDVRLALADYHQGPASVRRDGVLRITDRYTDDVLALRSLFD